MDVKQFIQNFREAFGQKAVALNDNTINEISELQS